MFINLTPHAVNVLLNGRTITIEPSGTVAGCSVSREQADAIESIPVNRTVFGTVEGLPKPQDGVYYMVSSLVAQALPSRTDLFVPDDVIRDEAGRVIGCRALARVSR